MKKKVLYIMLFIILSSQCFASFFNNDDVILYNPNLKSSDIDFLCNQDNSFLYRFGGLWGCGQLNASQMNITITYNITNITTYQLNESDPIAIPLIIEVNNSNPWTNSSTNIYPKDLTKLVGIGTDNPNDTLEIAHSEKGSILRLTNLLDTTWNQNDIFSSIQFYTNDSVTPGVNAEVSACHTRSGSGHTNSDSGLCFSVTTGQNPTLPTTEVMRITSGTYNVGIGTQNPSSKLHVSDSNPLITSTDTDTNISTSFSAAGTATANPRGALIISSTSGESIVNAGLQVYPNTSAQKTTFIETLTSGNTGIINTKRFVHQQSSTLASLFTTSQTGLSNGTPISIYTYGNEPQLYINNNGNVGIGTNNPLTLFHALSASTAQFTVGTLSTGGNAMVSFNMQGQTNWHFGADRTRALFMIGRSGTLTDNLSTLSPYFAINANGNVGIGTPSPSVKLDVNDSGIFRGNLNITSNLYVDGNARFGNSTGYVTFGNDGSMHMFGTARKSDQKVIEAKTASKGASAPTDTLRAIGASGGVLKPMVQFSKTIQQDIYFEFHAPYSVDISHPVTFHLVWAPGVGWTSGNYVWSLEYLVKNETEALNTGTPIIISANITPANANDLIETEFVGNITFTGDDQILVCHLYRNVSADNADDVGEVNMMEINFVRNSQGENIS